LISEENDSVSTDEELVKINSVLQNTKKKEKSRILFLLNLANSNHKPHVIAIHLGPILISGISISTSSHSQYSSTPCIPAKLLPPFQNNPNTISGVSLSNISSQNINSSTFESKIHKTLTSNDIPVAFGLLDGLWVAIYNPEIGGIFDTDVDNINVRKDLNRDNMSVGGWQLIVKPIHADLSVILKIKDTFVKSMIRSSSLSPPEFKSSLHHSLSPSTFSTRHMSPSSLSLGPPLSTSLLFNIHLATQTVDISIRRSHLVVLRDAAVEMIEFLKEQQKKV
jgi:hypothetical protein